ncbi:hypothetical protein GYMLUDRAFT_244299 [Collybiopsis luxurians FD-317 M1]|uniref:Reverse transcriptase Ty1/copia-type domain-containing protein n=1 Tax=Collybiopsis luxurians FD-317 M1 TaxID=944289 RepID=A0A0D0CCP5_9AGAR|nr:hypothetical protein GYMLUDRAFT_244299 [Collybiopsis luxurians FD-317 M1]
MYKSPPPKIYAPPVPSLPQVQDKIPQYFNPPFAENSENELVTPPIADPLPQREGIDDVDHDPGQVPPVVPEEGPADEHPIALRKSVRAHKPPEPQSFKETLNSPEADQWEQAMTEEITAHLTNGTWEIVNLPPGQVAIGSK